MNVINPGSTLMLKVNLNNILIDTIDSIQFYLSRTKDNNPTVTKTYKKDGSDKVQFNNGYFYVPFTQEDTLTFLGVKMVYFGIQINFTNKSVSKIDYKIFSVQKTIGTELIDGNTPSIDTTESYIEADFDIVYVLNISKEELQSYVQSSKINADTALPWEPYTGGIPSPNPDYPQTINSIGDSGSVDVVVSDNNGNSQTLTINTPNGLCGIPVDTGGNYTDSTGQQWVCDEVDFERGVYVQRVKKSTVKTLDKLGKTNEQGRYANWNIFSGYASAKVKSIIAIASYFIWGRSQPLKWVSAVDTNGIYISPPQNTDYTVDTLKSYLIPLLPFEVCGILATPIETPLTEEELAAYKAIKSYPHYTHIKSAAELKVKLKIF